MEKTIKKAKELWDELGNIPCDPINDDLIEEKFLEFPIGTEKTDIWHWFEDYFNIILAEELIYGIKIYTRIGFSDVIVPPGNNDPIIGTDTYLVGYEDRDGEECDENGKYLN